jgi:predicted amidophosphoribosyltransferase
MKNRLNCQNCNEPLALYWKFCPVCGETQQINDEDIKKFPDDKSFLNNHGVTVLGRKTVMLEGFFSQIIRRFLKQGEKK